MQVRTYTQQCEQPAHRGHNRPHVMPGTKVYGIYHEGKWFAYAYLDKTFAEHVCNKLKADVTLDTTLIPFNFKSDGPVAVSDRTKESQS